MSDITGLPIHCAFCHGAVTLQVSNWRTPNEGEPLSQFAWECPYCQKPNSSELPGDLRTVTTGHQPDKRFRDDQAGQSRIH